MQKSDSAKIAMGAHRKVRSSTTLNRRYIKRPSLSGDITVVTKRSPKLKHFATPSIPANITKETNIKVTKSDVVAPAVCHPLQDRVADKMRARKAVSKKQYEPSLSAKEIKERAIRKAIANAEAISTQQKNVHAKSGLHFGFGRVLLALSCAAFTAFAIAYFVNLNMPDLSLRVAAMQTGINASYPSYVPRNYSTTSISSEDGRVVIDFYNSANNNSFTIIEEVSPWDSNALLANYVTAEFGENYTVIREQGLTIYIGGSKAAWVNGGILYKINAQNGVLSNKQIRSIAVSL